MELPAEVAWLSLGFDKLPLQRAEIGDNVAFGLGRELSELIEGCEWLVFAEASDAAEPGAAADDGGTQVPRVAGVSAPVAAELGRSAAAERSRVRGQRLTRGTGRAMIVFHRAGRGRWPRWPNQMVCCQGVIFDPLAGSNGVRLLSTP